MLQSSIGWWKVSPVPFVNEILTAANTGKGFVFHRLRSSGSSSFKLTVHSKADFSSSQMDLVAQGCSGTLTGAVVALGKFDALHIGHRALAEQAARMGAPALLSFTGMAEVLGWEKRLPIVAPSDRARVMQLWSAHCDGLTPQEHALEFSKVRHLTPRQFVEKLAVELQVKGVVAGENYRFGYKAAGDSAELQRLCREWGVEVHIVNSVMDEAPDAGTMTTGDARDRGQVSSTRVRKALAQGNMRRVNELLGRSHRVIMSLEDGANDTSRGVMKIPLQRSCNQYPAPGSYQCRVGVQNVEQVNGAPSSFCSCKVEITEEETVVSDFDHGFRDGYLSLEF